MSAAWSLQILVGEVVLDPPDRPRARPSRPLSAPLVDALDRVEVRVAGPGNATFQLDFDAAAPALLDELRAVFGDGRRPLVRVILVARLGGVDRVLVDGVCTQHQLAPRGDAAAAFAVTGEDLGVVMDLVDRTGTKITSPEPEAQAQDILRRYAELGLRPSVHPPERGAPRRRASHQPRQQGSDLAHLRHLARQVGHVFHLDPGARPGETVAYWGPERRAGRPQPALTFDFGALRNVDDPTFSIDLHGAAAPRVTLPPRGQAAARDADFAPPRPALGRDPVPAVRRPRLDPSAARGRADTLRAGEAAAERSADVVTCSGKLDALRFGALLRPRRLALIRGVTPPFDGLYLVRSLTTTVRRGELAQTFELARAGLYTEGAA